ncbi:MAG: hypothetical protein J6V82_02380 [Clostridia bacterium]|nr:hypothetical protein [Clostridia bacterium]
MKKFLSVALVAVMIALSLCACDPVSTTSPSGYIVEGEGFVTIAGGQRLSTADCVSRVSSIVSTCQPTQSVTSIATTVKGNTLSSTEVFTVVGDSIKMDYSYEKNAEFIIGASNGYVYTETGSKTIAKADLANGDRFKLSPSCLTMNDAYYASVLAQNIEASDTITLKLTLNTANAANFFGMEIADLSSATVTYLCDDALSALHSLTVNFTYTNGATMVITANYQY